MDIAIGIVMLITGISILRKGELRFSSRSVSRGKPARIAAIILILTLPVNLFLNMILAFIDQSVGRPILGELLSILFSYIVMAVCALLAVIVASRGIQKRSGL